MEILELYEVNHVGDVSFKVDFGACEVHSFAQAGEGDGIGIVSLLSESTADSLPTLAAEPTTTDQHVSGHPKDLLLRHAGMGQDPWSTTRQERPARQRGGHRPVGLAPMTETSTNLGLRRSLALPVLVTVSVINWRRHLTLARCLESRSGMTFARDPPRLSPSARTRRPSSFA